ncbi:hypothetical protein VNI00_004378 [Paramarasmius palmivorus]|uniref:Ketopantoate reductase C-terminal domain-containing protein n=1 Tax=Paramarasmius palmivorus TaxID=297713 RepID=A0AAW0DML9_9AGAR
MLVVPSVLDAANQRYDYVFVSTKVIPEILPTEKILAPILSKSYTEKYGQPVYVLLQNGIGIEKGLAIAVENVAGQVAEDPESTQVFDDKKPRIVSACLYYLGNLIKPDVVEYVEGHKITIGVYRSGAFTTTQNSPQEAEVLDDVKNLLEPGGASVEVVSEIQRHRLKKNMLNLSFAAIATLSNQTTPSIFRPPPNPSSEYYEPYVHPMTAHLIEEYTVPNIAAVLTEAVSALPARALDIPDTEDGLPLDTVPKFIELARVLHVDPKNNHASSMLLDMRKGRPMEVEVILGEVVRLAKRVAVDVPVSLSIDCDQVSADYFAED